MNSKRIATIGECMIELAGLDTEVQLGFGGDTYNFAMYLNRIYADATVSYITRLGDDYFSEKLLKLMQGENIDTSFIEQIPKALPAIYAISLNEGERKFHYWRDQAPVRKMFEKPEPKAQKHLAEVDCVVFSGITLAVLTSNGQTRLFDCVASAKAKSFAYIVNHRPILWSSHELALELHTKALALADYFIISDEELQMLYPSTSIQELSKNSNAQLVVTAGTKGCTIWQQGECIEKIEVEKVKAVDTTAAGDSFAARYIAGRLANEEVKTAATYACQLAGHVIGYHGALMPTEKLPSQCLILSSIK